MSQEDFSALETRPADGRPHKRSLPNFFFFMISRLGTEGIWDD